jgi:hypothetical protein
MTETGQDPYRGGVPTDAQIDRALELVRKTAPATAFDRHFEGVVGTLAQWAGTNAILVPRQRVLARWLATGGAPVPEGDAVPAPAAEEPSPDLTIVPGAIRNIWTDQYAGSEYAELAAAHLAAAVAWAFNPPDGDGDQETLLADAILRAARYIDAQPCACTDDGPCDRCQALGRWHNRPVDP